VAETEKLGVVDDAGSVDIVETYLLNAGESHRLGR
jgi:hypothetical protein